MDGIVLQGWITLRGQASAGVTSVIQSELAWADLAIYRDVVAWLEVREVSADAGVTVQVMYQTAPAKDEALFSTMATVAMATGITMTQMLAVTATTPLARYMRWKVGPATPTTTNPWDATFRIILAANRPGRASLRPTSPRPLSGLR